MCVSVSVSVYVRACVCRSPVPIVAPALTAVISI